MKNRQQAGKNRERGTGLNNAKVFTLYFAVFYCAMLVMQSASICFAETSALEGKIIGTGTLKVWMNIGSDKGVETDMVFEVRKGEEIIAKVLVKKVGMSSSEADITQLKEGATCQSGDTVKFLSKAALEQKPEPKMEESKTEETKPEIKKEEPKKEETKSAETTAPAVTPVATTAPAAETAPKTDDKKPVEKKRAKKKFGSGLFKISSTKFLYIAVIGLVVFAIGGGGGKSSGGGGSASSPDQTSQTAPTLPPDF